jgi:putative membrane protein
MQFSRALILVTSAALVAIAAHNDKDFVTKAAQGSKLEVELARKAMEKTSNPQVKQFATELMDDHTKASRELEVLAQKKGYSLDSDLSMMNKAKVTKLGMYSDGFDKAFISAMIDDHKEDIAEFELASTSTDADVKSFATKTLPVLRKHLQKASEISHSLGAK